MGGYTISLPDSIDLASRSTVSLQTGIKEIVSSGLSLPNHSGSSIAKSLTAIFGCQHRTHDWMSLTRENPWTNLAITLFSGSVTLLHPLRFDMRITSSLWFRLFKGEEKGKETTVDLTVKAETDVANLDPIVMIDFWRGWDYLEFEAKELVWGHDPVWVCILLADLEFQKRVWSPYNPDDTDAYLRYMLRKRLQWIKNDDKMIKQKVVWMLFLKMKFVGMFVLLSVDEMCQQLRDWLDLFLNHSVPSSLLILSRYKQKCGCVLRASMVSRKENGKLHSASTDPLLKILLLRASKCITKVAHPLPKTLMCFIFVVVRNFGNLIITVIEN
ncbi:hypothetical protein L2E82_32433 [Cichorium intybus]|uniref:Uncharacterized protein n=1 Tax=Cichorium intybus TaxID=13427 RepID=A0ACB9BH72_CICIN|nr:hypothetical protein L2E82_32433 [Cichorium intybus]